MALPGSRDSVDRGGGARLAVVAGRADTSFIGCGIVRRATVGKTEVEASERPGLNTGFGRSPGSLAFPLSLATICCTPSSSFPNSLVVGVKLDPHIQPMTRLMVLGGGISLLDPNEDLLGVETDAELTLARLFGDSCESFLSDKAGLEANRRSSALMRSIITSLDYQLRVLCYILIWKLTLPKLLAYHLKPPQTPKSA